jgi:hypothetical protein
MPKKKLTKKEALLLRKDIAMNLSRAVLAACEAGVINEPAFDDWVERIVDCGGCPECAYEIVLGEPGPYDRHMCEDW